MFKLDYLPLRSTDETIVAAWFACQNGSKLLDSIMKWISRKKEQLQLEQAHEEAKGGCVPIHFFPFISHHLPCDVLRSSSNPSLGPRKPSLLKRMVGKGK